MKKVNVIIERGKDGLFSLYMDDDTLGFGLNGQGDSVESAEADFLGALAEMKSYFEDENKEFPSLEFNYHYDVNSFLDYYAGILSKSGLEKITGINQKQLWHYSAKDTTKRREPRKETILKIQNGLHKFAEELSRISFID